MKLNWVDYILIGAILMLAMVYGWYALYPKIFYNFEAVYIEPKPYDSSNATYSIYTSEKPTLPALKTVSSSNQSDGLSPSSVEIGNFALGFVAEHYLDVSNGSDFIRAFKVYATKPDNYRTKSNTYMPLEWVRLLADNGKVMVEPHSTTRVPVIIAVPPDAKVSGKDFETWFRMQDWSIFNGEKSAGMINTFNGSRWILHFK